jgi:signal transduction histidine kinase
LGFRLYAATLGLLVLAVLPAGWTAFLQDPAAALYLTVLTAAASLLTVPMLPDLAVDVLFGAPVAVAAAVLLPPPLAVVVGFLGLVSQRELRGLTSPWHSLFNRSQLGLSAGAAALMAERVAEMVPTPIVSGVAATLVGVVAYDVVNIGLNSLSLWLLGRLPLSQAAHHNLLPFPRFGLDFLLISALAVPIVIIYRELHPLGVLLLALPLGLGFIALRSARQSADQARELTLQVRELETLNALSRRLLAEGDPLRVASATRDALRSAIDTEEVVVSLAGEVPADLRVVPVPGVQPAAIGVPHDLHGASVEAVEAVAGLLGMSLERNELSEELAEVERARTALSGRILEEGTRERSRIALEIHDDVLPYLAAAGIQADNVRSSLATTDTARAAQLATVAQDAINDGIGRLREVLASLHTQIIVPGSLRPGLEAALEDLRVSHGVEGELLMADEIPALPLAVEILVLETVRGCLTNIARHAKARHAMVVVDFKDSGISATICDDGQGFDPAAVREGHHGLSLMAQRVELARGRFVVSSAPGAGTRIQVEVPR